MEAAETASKDCVINRSETGFLDLRVNQRGNRVHALLGTAAEVLTRQQLAEVDWDLVVRETGPQWHIWLRSHVLVDDLENGWQMARGTWAHDFLCLHALVREGRDTHWCKAAAQRAANHDVLRARPLHEQPGCVDGLRVLRQAEDRAALMTPVRNFTETGLINGAQTMLALNRTLDLPEALDLGVSSVPTREELVP